MSGRSTMRRETRALLLAAYLGAETLPVICRRLRVCSRAVQRFWDRCRAAGLIPDQRPHFVKFYAVTPADIDPDGGDDYVDATPQLGGADGSLKALREHHADLDNAPAQTAPREWLRFDGRGVPPPTHAQLMAMCRAYDAHPARVAVPA